MDKKSTPVEIIAVSSKSAWKTFKVTKPFRELGGYFQIIYRKLMDVDHGRVPEPPAEFTYIVIGYFPKDLDTPEERLIWLQEGTDILESLHKSISRLRGWNNLISLKSLRYFSLYKVSSYSHSKHSRRPEAQTIKSVTRQALCTLSMRSASKIKLRFHY
jgi:hypothetical protein